MWDNAITRIGENSDEITVTFLYKPSGLLSLTAPFRAPSTLFAVHTCVYCALPRAFDTLCSTYLCGDYVIAKRHESDERRRIGSNRLFKR